MDIVIRELGTADLNAATDIWNEVVREGKAFPQITELDVAEAKDFFAEQERTAVAVTGNEVLGLYILHPNNIGRCSGVANASYAVRSDMRGQGIGRQLVSDSLVAAGQLGFTGLQFNAVIESNVGARQLYEDLGFYHVGVIPRGFLNGNGEREDMHIYYHPCNDHGSDPVLYVSEVVAMEQDIAASGTSLYELMQRAGRAIADAAKARIEKLGVNLDETCILVLAGSGNNGGDGWVAARLLAEAGASVTLATTRAAADIKAQPAARSAAETVRSSSGNLVVAVNPDAGSLEDALANADIVIDSLLGTGFSHSSLRSPLDNWVKAVNEARLVRARAERPLWVIAADVPSGLSAQSGVAAEPCIRADETVTMLAYKKGLMEPTAVPHVGRIVLADLKPW